MYEATGVRRETGKQAKLLNMIMEQDIFKLNMEQFQEKLKEFVGPYPSSGVRRRYFRSNSGIACESDVLVFWSST